MVLPSRNEAAILEIMEANLNISLPPSLKDWVQEQIDRGGYVNASEYIRQLIREERRRQGRMHIEKKLQEAIESGGPSPVNAATWKESEKRVQKRINAARKDRRNGTHR